MEPKLTPIQSATQALREFNQAVADYLERLRHLPPERVRTGIEPNRRRSRRKQRLTRLQRRAKRQRK